MPEDKAPGPFLHDWGHVGPKSTAEMTVLRLDFGGVGACHRRAPVGEAAKRILWRVNPAEFA